MIMKETDVMPGKSAEESLDPEDWESMRTLGHRILDDMMDYLKTLMLCLPFCRLLIPVSVSLFRFPSCCI